MKSEKLADFNKRFSGNPLEDQTWFKLLIPHHRLKMAGTFDRMAKVLFAIYAFFTGTWITEKIEGSPRTSFGFER